MRRLQAVPAVVLVTIVAVAAVGRLRRTSFSETARAASVTTATSLATPPSSASSTPDAGLDAPLRASSPPPAALVSAGAPRMIHGSPRHTHRSAARGPRGVKVGWRTTLGGPIAAQVTASPDEATLYVSTLDGAVTALSRADGTKRWSVALGERVYSAPLVHDDGTLYVGTDAKKLVAIDPKGTVLFRLELEGEADTGATFGKDGNVVIAAGSRVYSVRRGGDIAWRFATKGKVFTSPAVTEDGLVIVGAQDDSVYALGPAGALVWATDLGADVDGSPAIADDGAIYVGSDKGEVIRLDGHGKVVWRTPVGGFVRGALSVARDGDVLVGTYGPVPRLVRLSPEGTIRGAFPVRGTGAREFGIHGGPVEDAEGVLFFGAQDDTAYALGPDGALRWRFETKADVDAPLSILSDGSLVVPSEDGSVTMLLP